MITKILFVQSFILEKSMKYDAITDEILIWEVYLENFLKSKHPNLKFDLLYLPIEQKSGNITIKSFEEIEKFSSQMDKLISNLDFAINEETLLCISGTNSHNFLPSKFIAEYFQERFPTSIVVFGGRHATARPYDFDYINSPVDYVVIGEGEIPLYNIIKSNPNKHDIPIKSGQQLVPDLNSLPIIDFSIIDKIIPKFKHLAINLSRGCPFQCSFCMEKDLTDERFKSWRVYSPNRAIQETRRMIEYGDENGIELYGFYDPIFGMKKSWLNKFLDMYEPIDNINFLVETRLDILNEKMLEKFHARNFLMWYGLESYSKEMLLRMNKTKNPTEYLNKFDEVYQIHKKLEIPAKINVLCNHPGDTKESYLTTFNQFEKMVREDNIDLNNFQIRLYRHYPGTPVYNDFQHYREQYGSEVYFPEWFKNEDNLYGGKYCVRPSNDFSLTESIELFREKYSELINLKTNKLKKNNLPGSFAGILGLKQNIKNLENYVQSILDFVNENNEIIGIEATTRVKKL